MAKKPKPRHDRCPGCSQPIEWDYDECDECCGHGADNIGSRCWACGGTGERRFALPCDCESEDDP